MSNQLRSILLSLVALFVLIAGGVGLYIAVTDEDNSSDDIQQEADVDSNVTVVVELAEVSTYQTNFAEGDTVFGLLIKLDDESDDFEFEYDEFEGLGAFLTSINGQVPADNEFIEFVVNDEQAPVGVSDYELEEDDEVTFRIVGFDEFEG